LINEEPYGKGWLFVITVNEPKLELKQLMGSEKAAKYYKTIIDEEKEKFGDYDEP